MLLPQPDSANPHLRCTGVHPQKPRAGAVGDYTCFLGSMALQASALSSHPRMGAKDPTIVEVQSPEWRYRSHREEARSGEDVWPYMRSLEPTRRIDSNER